MADRRHHGEGKHDERDVAMPAVPGTSFVMVETELVLGSLEAVFDRPVMTFDLDQRVDRSPNRAPGGEVGVNRRRSGPLSDWVYDLISRA
jgi:hypothetical protein